MSRLSRHLLLFSLLLSPVLALGQAGAAKTAAGQPQQEADNPAARQAWFLRGRVVLGKNAAALLHRAFQQKLAIRKAQQRAAAQRAAAQPAGTATATGAVGVAAVPVIGPAWTNIGPAPITGMQPRYGDASGRITALVVDPNDTTGNIVYAAGAYGGVWRTSNGTASPGSVQWAPLFDTDPAASTLSIGAITVQPSNSSLILVGTGEPDNAIDSYYGQGILRSADGGTTWSLISTANAGAISFKGLGFSKFAFSTLNTASLTTNLVVAGGAQTPLGIETGLVPAGCPTCGIYYSTDAGATWHLASTTDPGGVPIQYWRVTDVVFDAVVQKFFAVIAFHGFYSSPDGINWTRVADPAPTDVSATPVNTTNCPAATNTGTCQLYRGNLAVQPATGDLYLVYIRNSTTATPQIFRANFTSGQVTGWTAITITTGISACGDGQGCGTGGQGFYDLYVAAVPNGGNTDLYFGAVNLFKCNVNGANPTCSNASSWLNLTHVYGTCSVSYHSMHPDNHVLAFHPANPGLLYFGNDGGVYRSLNGTTLTVGSCSSTSGNTFDDLNNGSLGSLTQFIAISTDLADASVTLGGTQDNGSPAIAGGQTSPPLTAPLWFEAEGGDGGFNHIDSSGANWYTAMTDVSIRLCSSGTACIESATFSQIVGNSQVGGDHGAFYTPYILDPNNQSQIILGTCRVWRGPNSSAGWPASALSPNFQTGGSGGCTGNEANTIHGLAAGGTAIGGVSPVIYAGTDGGHIWVTTNSTTWTDTTFHGPGSTSVDPGGFPIPGVAIDTLGDPTGNTAYITVMGFTGGTGHVWKTTTAGVNWTDITGNLPDAPVNSVVVDPGNHTIIYVGTDVGVFMTTDTTLGAGTTWSEWGAGLPNVAVVSLAATNNGHLRAGTHGRGVFQTDLATANDYTLSISNTPKRVYVANLPAAFNGTAVATGGYNSPVTLTCTAGVTSPPATCTPSPTPITPTAGAGTALTITASGAAADYLFNLHGVGADVNTTTHDTPITLHVVDFSVGAAPTTVNVPQGDAGTTTLTVTAAGSFTDTVLVACRTPLPAGIACSYSQNSFVPSNAGTSVAVVFSTTPATAAGSVVIPVDVTGSSAGAPTKTVNITVNVTAGVPGLSFVPVTPCRVADTRNAAGPFGGPFISANTSRGFTVPNSACGIPNTAQAYSVNLTVVPHGSLGFLTAYPCGQALPLASNLNSIDGRVKAVAAIVPAGTSGGLCAFASNDTDLVIDIDGYFVPNTTPSTLAFYPLTPCRLVDTRLAAGPLGGPTMAGNSTRTFPILSSPCGVPNTALAYSLNYTVVPSGGLGFLTTWPAGQVQPLVSTLNATTGTVTANAAIVPAATNGDINVFVTNTTDVIIDINGYFAPPAAGGLSFYPLTPCRVLDTRNPAGSPPFSGTKDINVVDAGCGAPISAQSFVLNATVVPAGSLGFLSLWPQGAPQPLVSTLNAIDATVTSNLAIVPTTNGSISAFPSNPTHLILDMSGFFAP